MEMPLLEYGEGLCAAGTVGLVTFGSAFCERKVEPTPVASVAKDFCERGCDGPDVEIPCLRDNVLIGRCGAIDMVVGGASIVCGGW
jgi:hypothetical protein